MTQHKYDGYEIERDGTEDPDSYTQERSAELKSDNPNPMPLVIGARRFSTRKSLTGSLQPSSTDIELGSVTSTPTATRSSGSIDELKLELSVIAAQINAARDQLKVELNAMETRLTSEHIQPLEAQLERISQRIALHGTSAPDQASPVSISQRPLSQQLFARTSSLTPAALQRTNSSLSGQSWKTRPIPPPIGRFAPSPPSDI